MEPTIFTKIINGDVPCHKVYEDDKTIAFMDINPVQPGMVVVVSKMQIDNFEDLPDDSASAMILTAKKIMLALRKLFPGKIKIAVRIEGLDVPHAHMTVYPINSADEFRAYPKNEEPNHDELAQLAEKLRSNL